jgi:methyl-accepting chemotaxis protein
MVKTAFAKLALANLALARLATACLAAFALFSCVQGPAYRGFDRITLDTGDGRGPQAYSGEELPAPGDGAPHTFVFSLAFSPARADMPNGPVLVAGPSSYPYRMYLNGTLVHRFGGLKGPSTGRNFRTTEIAVPDDILGRSNELRIEAEVRTERAPLMDLSLADARGASAAAFWRSFFMSNLVTGAILVCLILCFYFLCMYVLYGRSDRRFIWFALICATFALAYANIVFNFEAVDEALITKASRSGFFFTITMLSFYVMESTGILHRSRLVKAGALALAATASAFVCAQRDYLAANAAFHTAITWVIVPNLLFCIVLVAIASAKKGPRRFAFLIAAMAGVVATSLFDMAYESRNAMPYAWTLAYGYLWLVLAVFFDLAIAQARVYRTSLQQARDLNLKNAAMEAMIRHVRENTDALRASTEELAVSTREMSATGNQQAAAVKEIVSTMEDANSFIRGISAGSSTVREESKDAAMNAEEGVGKVKTALEKLEAVIGRISESISMISDFNDQLGSITDVVKLIEGIATQIRIIAFNASLEAVAAGEAGKNFKIVAEEVKRLADSTMASVKSIRSKVTGLISTSDDVVKAARLGYMSLEQSWDIASGIGTTFGGIAEAAESSACATAEIDSSIREESTAFEQILKTLKEIASGVENFVQSARNTSETTERLNLVAERLVQIIADPSAGSANGSAGETIGAGGEKA